MIVTLDEVKTHLRIDHDAEDAYLESLIRQAQAVAESFGCDPADVPQELAALDSELFS